MTMTWNDQHHEYRRWTYEDPRDADVFREFGRIEHAYQHEHGHGRQRGKAAEVKAAASPEVVTLIVSYAFVPGSESPWLLLLRWRLNEAGREHSRTRAARIESHFGLWLAGNPLERARLAEACLQDAGVQEQDARWAV